MIKKIILKLGKMRKLITSVPILLPILLVLLLPETLWATTYNITFAAQDNEGGWGDVPQGATNQPVLKIKTTLVAKEATISSIRVHSLNTADADVTNVHIYTDNADAVFDGDETLQGSTDTWSVGYATITTNFTIAAADVNFYIYVTYDVSGSAGIGNTLDCDIEAVGDINVTGDVDNSAYSLSGTGSRIVAAADNSPPCAISDLTALAEGSTLGSRIKIKWTAPGDDGTGGGNASYFLVKYSSNYIGADDFYAAWVSTWGLFSTGTAAGSEELHVLTGFDEGTTYYFAIRTRDEKPNWSIWPGTSTNINSLSFTVPTDSAPIRITSLSALTGSTGGEIDLDWLAPGDDGTIGDITNGMWRIKYSSDSTHIWDTMSYTLDISTSATYGLKYSTTLAGLNEGATYYFYIKAGDEKPNWSGLSNKATAWAKVTPPPTPTTVVISQIGENYDGTAAPDYVELYNTTNEPIDLSAASVQRGTGDLGTITKQNLSGTIPAYGFYLVGDEDAVTPALLYPLTPDTTNTTWTINEGDWVAYVSNQTNVDAVEKINDPDVVDWVGLYDGVTPNPNHEGADAAPDPGAGYCERLSQLGDLVADLQNGGSRALFGNSYDTNENANDFVRTTTGEHPNSKPQNSESPHEIPSTPTISGFTPDTGPVGTTVTINGTYFGAVRISSDAYSHIYFYNGVEADYTIGDFVWCDTKVVVGVPAGAETGKIWFCTQDDFAGHTGTSTVNFTLGAAEDTTPPAAISDLTALAEGSTLGGRITVKWTAPGDDGTGGGNASQFLVKYSTNYIGADDFYAAWVSTWGLFSTGTAAGSEELHVLTGFDEGTTYYFAIRTRDEIPNWSIWPGTSTNVNSLSFTIPTDSAPATITSLSALTGSSGGEIDLTWLAPGDDGTIGDISTGTWRIKYSSDSTHTWDTMSYTLDISTSASYGLKYSTTIAGLLNETTYYFYIEAGDEKPNWSGLSNKTTAQTLDAVAPAAISDLTALEGSNGGEVKLKWTAPGDNGMTGNIAGGAYKIKYSSVAIITGSQFDSPPASYT
ncbi:MAG: IPT/TIG domain-containing protein, partial [bacterium]